MSAVRMQPKTRWRSLWRSAAALALVVWTVPAVASHADLVALFDDWRRFEPPALNDGVPDYTAAAMSRKLDALRAMRARLDAIDTNGWSTPQRVDHRLVRAEMNGLEFYLRVLRPWARDPSFYASIRASQSDTPAEEGPTIHGAVRLWKYPVWPRTSLSVLRPLSRDEQRALARELRTIPPLLEQARGNLAASDARDLWLGGIGTMRGQSATLARLAERTRGAGRELEGAIRAAREATDRFAAWLAAEAPSKKGPSGIGKDHYTWHLRNVLLVPRTWDEEFVMLRQELDRAHASLRLEEQRNRSRPSLDPVPDAPAFARLQQESITRYLEFLRTTGFMNVRDYYDQALRERTFDFHPEATRHFFHQATHRDPTTLWTHLLHYWDLAAMEREPHSSPIRRGPLLYNIWMSRSEGMTTGLEEWAMHAGLYDASPRSREIVWVMLAQRAARGLATLRAHANEIDMEQASRFHVQWTPRGWMRPDQDLLGFEQLLYMRQPGYGTSYLTGAREIDALLRQRAASAGAAFTTRAFFDEVFAVGLIPVAMIAWELTGDGREAERLGLEPLP